MADKKKFNPAAAAERILNISSAKEENTEEKIANDTKKEEIQKTDIIIEKKGNMSKKNMADEKGNPLVQKSYYITEKQYMAIQIAAAKRKIKSSEIVRAAIDEYLKNEIRSI